MSWIEKLDFQQSIKEIKKEERLGKDFCLDPLRFEDLSAKGIAQDVENLAKKKIEKGKIDPLIEIDVPKANYVLRPGARPNLIDWVSYNTIVNFIGSQIYRQIPSFSFSFNSFRGKFKKDYYKTTIDCWLDFDKESILLSEKFKFLLTTDIVSFYENISLEVLRDRLLILSKDKDYKSAVTFLTDNILFSWAQKIKIQKFGLPQGPTASSVLADIYLYSFDREMKKNKITFIRYMDDIRIYAKTRQDLKKNMIVLVRSLRDLNLHLSAKKTFIFETTQTKLMERVFDPERGTLNLIDEACRSGKKDQIRLVIPAFSKVFRLSEDPNNPFNERHFKFFISHVIDLMRFGFLKKSNVRIILKKILKTFEEKHHLSDKICWFLVATSRYDKEFGKIIKERLFEFILNKDKNIYDWQEMWALDTIRQIGNIKKGEINRLKRHVSQHELCQAQLCLIQAENGSIDDREESLDKIKTNQLKNDQYRYYFLASQEIPKHLLEKVGVNIPKYFRNYVYSLGGRKYGFKFFLKKKELIYNYFDY